WEALGTVYPRELKGSEQTGQMGEEGESAELAEAEITEIRGRGQLDVAVEEAHEDDGDGFETPIHTFEKAETLEESSGLSRRKDAADELRDHEEALRQLDMTHVLRSRERPASIYRADVLFDAVAFETAGSGNRGIPYPEWDFRKRRYRDGWCRVHASEVEIADMAWITDALARRRGLIQTLKKSLAAAANERRRSRRQPAGPEFDLDAVVEGQVARRAGCAPSENIYQEKRRALYDIAALLLLDRSYSTEGYLGGRRVLDLIRETIACVGEVLDELLDQFAIAAFSSDTRHHCAFDWVKPFGVPWRSARARLGGIRAAGYTRIGPALRHAQEVLMPLPAARKVVILITDGRPCDYDRYEGLYGIQDVKRAISTGKDHGIDTHAFAIETRARETFPTMFSRQHFHIIPKPEALTTSLCELFSRLRTG
ncbi:MAG: VWA domain-containing protein, partial [Verrucomicrobiales bacterium]